MAFTKQTRVGVLMGGMSTERTISIKSGTAVLCALQARGWNAVAIDMGPDLAKRLEEEGVEVAWLALHGQFGEDGCVQGMLEILRIPYTGSGASASSAAMDKIITKRCLEGAGLALPGDHTWRKGEVLPGGITYPVVAKTPEGGSTLGIQICSDEAHLLEALEALKEMDDEVLLEDFVAGREITVAVLDGESLPVVEIETDSGFFDFDAKYTKGATRYLVPAPLSQEITMRAKKDAATAYRLLGLHGIARADFIVDASGVPFFLEINTIPGMTATSLSPMAAAEAGISFEVLVERILLSARLELENRSGLAESP
jgi:D-alanine-D-alanine ligase